MSRLRNRLGIEDADVPVQDASEEVSDISEKTEDTKVRNKEACVLQTTGIMQKEEDDLDDILGNSAALENPESTGSKQTEKSKKKLEEESSPEKAVSEHLRKKKGKKQDKRKNSEESRQKSNRETTVYGKEPELDPLPDIDNDLHEIQKLRIQEKRRDLVSRFALLIMAAGCVYAIFLIFGVFMTDYQYDSTGEVKAQVLTVDDIKARNNYNVLKVQYE